MNTLSGAGLYDLVEGSLAELEAAKDRFEVQMKSCGKFAKKCRENKGLRQAEVAGVMGISANFLSELEHSRRNWSPKLVRLWDQALKELSDQQKAKI